MGDMKANILNWNKEVLGSMDLPVKLFGTLPSNKGGVLSEVVRWQRAAKRAGTHKAKTRGEVRGGGKKPFRQKGTGNARQGSIRSPLNEAGGVTFGPRPKSWAYSLPHKVRALGLKQALSYLHHKEHVFIVEDMHSVEGKTKELSTRLKKMGISKALLVDTKGDVLFKRALRNLPFFKFLPVKALNVYDLLKYHCLVISKQSMEELVSSLSSVSNNKQTGLQKERG